MQVEHFQQEFCVNGAVCFSVLYIRRYTVLCMSWLILISWLWYIQQTDTLHMLSNNLLPCGSSIHGSSSPRSVLCQSLQKQWFCSFYTGWCSSLKMNPPPFSITMYCFFIIKKNNNNSYYYSNCPSFGQESPFNWHVQYWIFRLPSPHLVLSSRDILDF